jgi:hypothetical protein
MDLSHWIRTPYVSIDFRRDFGKEMLVATNNRQPKFQLVPKYLTNGFGEDTVVRFSLKFDEGRMLRNWDELQFVPRGNQPVPALSRKLPAWSPEQEDLYADVLDPLATALQAETTKIEHLEAKIPMFLCRCADSKRQMTVDRVRLVYLKDAVEGPKGTNPNPNLVVVAFSWADGFKVMQNGVGSGPPRSTDP